MLFESKLRKNYFYICAHYTKLKYSKIFISTYIFTVNKYPYFNYEQVVPSKITFLPLSQVYSWLEDVCIASSCKASNR